MMSLFCIKSEEVSFTSNQLTLPGAAEQKMTNKWLVSRICGDTPALAILQVYDIGLFPEMPTF